MKTKQLPKYRGLTDAQKRDFKLYCAKLPKVGDREILNTNTPATSLAHWYWLWDTHGIRAPYRNQMLCWRLVQAKEQLNLTIKLWLEDLLRFDLVLGAQELLSWMPQFPPWVKQSLLRQFEKRTQGQYIPTYYNLTSDCWKNNNPQ